MSSPAPAAPSFPRHGQVGMALVLLGEAMILSRARPVSDYYFTVVWAGFILTLDGALYRQTGASLFCSQRRRFFLMLPMSAAFWWLFELFNQALNDWKYVGGNMSGVWLALIASIDFSTVLLAVWTAAMVVNVLLPGDPLDIPAGRGAMPTWIPAVSLAAGILFAVLAVTLPHYFFGLAWGCIFLILDPLNYWLNRPSMLLAAWLGKWRGVISFALGALLCGFFWESWNYWSMPKWVYNVPYVGVLHVFEMPILGYLGYLPFGLELFAMATFVFSCLRLRPIGPLLRMDPRKPGREEIAS